MAARNTITTVSILALTSLFFLLHFLLLSQQPSLDPSHYGDIRDIDAVKDSGIPLYEDPLSYGGRFHLFVPLSYYAVGFFGVFFSTTLALFLVLSISLASILPLSYAILRNLQQPKGVAFIVAITTALVPALFLPLPLPVALGIPLLLLAVRFFQDIGNSRSFLAFLIVSLLLALTSPLFLLLVSGIFVHLLLLRLESYNAKKEETESALFLLLFGVWLYIIIYKQSLLINGLDIFRQNMPRALPDTISHGLTVTGLFLLIGIVPLLFGIMGVYRSFFQTKLRPAMILIGIAASAFVTLWLQWIQPAAGMLLLGIGLSLLSALPFTAIIAYVQKSKISAYRVPVFGAGIVLLFALSLGSALLADQTHADPLPGETIQALGWIQENTSENATILSTLEEGHAVAALSQRKNVMDTDFMGIPDIDERHDDLNRMYTAKFETDALRLLTKYDVDYILFTRKAAELYNITAPAYLDVPCFRQVYRLPERAVIVYEVACTYDEGLPS